MIQKEYKIVHMITTLLCHPLQTTRWLDTFSKMSYLLLLCLLLLACMVLAQEDDIELEELEQEQQEPEPVPEAAAFLLIQQHTVSFLGHSAHACYSV